MHQILKQLSSVKQEPFVEMVQKIQAEMVNVMKVTIALLILLNQSWHLQVISLKVLAMKIKNLAVLVLTKTYLARLNVKIAQKVSNVQTSE